MSFATVLYFIVLICGLLCRKNRAISFICLLYMWLLFALNTNSPDYRSYEAVFSGTYYGQNMGIGYTVINTFIHNMGWDYFAFRMIWGGIYVFLLANYTFRCTQNPNFVFALLLICPVLLDASGIRSCVAYGIAVNCSLLLKRASKTRKLFYVLGVILSMTIHFTALFYLVFLLMDRKITKKARIYILLGVTVVSFLIFSPLSSYMAKLIYDATGIYVIQKWFLGGSTNTNPNLMGILSVAVFIVGFCYCANYQNIYLNQRDKSEIQLLGKQLSKSIIQSSSDRDYLYRECLLILYLIPVISISIEGMRMLFGSLVIFYNLTANCFSKKDSVSRYSGKTVYIAFLEILLAVGLLLMYLFSYPAHDVFAVLRENLIFQKLW